MNRINLLKHNNTRLKNRLDRLIQKSDRLSWIRLGIILLGILFTVLALILSNEILSAIAIFHFLIAFSVASFIHQKFKQSIKMHKLWHSIKSEHLSRATLNWQNIPQKMYKPESRHPFEIDLDISGNHSLHRLLDNTSSKNASDRLLAWFLIKEPHPEVVLNRQQLVKELIPFTRFRDKMKLHALMATEEIFDGNIFIEWINNLSEGMPGKIFLTTLISLALINITLFILNSIGLIPVYYLISLIVYILLFQSKTKIVGRLFWEAVDLSDEILKISHILIFLEKYPLEEGSGINNLLQSIRKAPTKPSRHVKSLHAIMSLFSFRRNIVIQFILNIVLPVDYILTVIFIRIKLKIKAKIPAWLDCWYELEALSSLANFAWLNPAYTFPQFDSRHSILKCSKIGHPLIPRDQKCTNDFEIKNIGDIILITGSNMSGKSTFLRTVGINICLAQAGSVADAEMLTMQFLRLFTCIKIDDNLAEGLSYFYAEVKRLKRILNELQSESEYPLLYLIDEIYKGTNNQERLSGSRAYIKSLSTHYGAGIVSTHDLELTYLESELNSLQNFHFHEQIEKDKMLFDFKLRKGPCPTTNALIIMKNEGLPT